MPNNEASYFYEAVVTRGGQERQSLGQKGIMRLPIVEMVCCRHVNSVLGMLREHTQDRFRLVILDDRLPDASCYSRSAAGIGEIRLTTGILSLAAVLAARCAVIMEANNFLLPWMPALARESSAAEALPHSLWFGDFDLSDAKRDVTALDDENISELADELTADIHLVRNTSRIASAAIEFLVLHEMGHFDAQHDEIKRTNKANVGVSVQRVFEHQADIFAVRLMLALGMMRPIGEQGPLIPNNVKYRQSNNLLAYLGSSLVMTFVTLLRSREPNGMGTVELIRSVKGEHPLPTTRLLIADGQVQIELKDPLGRQAIWPGSGETEAITLKGMTMNTLFLALTTLATNWRTAVNTIDPRKPLPTNVRYWLEDEVDLSDAKDSLQPDAVQLAMKLVKQASGQFPSDDFSVVYG